MATPHPGLYKKGRYWQYIISAHGQRAHAMRARTALKRFRASEGAHPGRVGELPSRLSWVWNAETFASRSTRGSPERRQVRALPES